MNKKSIEDQNINLIELFSWNTNFKEFLSSLIENDIIWRFKQFSIYLDNAPKKYRKLGKLLLTLPIFNLKRIINSPEFINHLILAQNKDSAVLFKFIERSIQTELFVLGNINDSECFTNIGSANGDLYYNKKSDCIHVNETVENDIILDFESPYAMRKLHASSFRGICFSKWESHKNKEFIINRIKKAYLLLGESCEFAQYFVKLNTQVIIPRKDNLFKDDFTSSSSRSFIGRNIFFNTHSQNATKVKIICALVHESIHSFLYRLELLRLLVNKNKNKVISPWSKSVLRLNTYVHACFIYYAHWMLLNRIYFKKSNNIKEKRKYLEKIKCGFCSDLYSEQISYMKKYLTHNIWIQLKKIPFQLFELKI